VLLPPLPGIPLLFATLFQRASTTGQHAVSFAADVDRISVCALTHSLSHSLTQTHTHTHDDDESPGAHHVHLTTTQ